MFTYTYNSDDNTYTVRNTLGMCVGTIRQRQYCDSNEGVWLFKPAHYFYWTVESLEEIAQTLRSL